uniref:Uncharacterized protein n=1 Tax=Kalanchoe fedtschenkoi TaxID=63787 RepID=A0A7N0TE01_KALFE
MLEANQAGWDSQIQHDPCKNFYTSTVQRKKFPEPGMLATPQCFLTKISKRATSYSMAEVDDFKADSRSFVLCCLVSMLVSYWNAPNGLIIKCLDPIDRAGGKKLLF